MALPIQHVDTDGRSPVLTGEDHPLPVKVVSGGPGSGGDVNVTNFPDDYPDAEAQDRLAAIRDRFTTRFGQAHKRGTPVVVSNVGDTTVYTPTPGTAILVSWVGFFTVENASSVIAAIGFGAATSITDEIYRVPMGKTYAFAHGTSRLGDVDEKLIVNLSAARAVYVNIDVEEV